MAKILWSDIEKTAILEKENGSKIEISVGTILTHPGRPLGIKITGFSQKLTDKRGPVGIYYLPWRGNRWADVAWSIKGDPRHLIAFPVGTVHYGEQVDWETVELLDADRVLQIQMFLMKFSE
jgi:hypothetical protein